MDLMFGSMNELDSKSFTTSKFLFSTAIYKTFLLKLILILFKFFK